MWSLYKNKKLLDPLLFSNGKTQADIVREVLEAIKEGNKIILIKGMCGTGKCLEKDTLVFCKPDDEDYFSYYKISDLTEKKGRIFSVNKNGEIVESNFKNVRKTGKKKLYKLKTRTGREIIVSKNHPFLTLTENGIEWMPLEKLSLNSYICLPNKLNLKTNHDCSDNEIKVLAHLIAEGKLGDKAGSPSYYQNPKQNPIIRADYKNALKELFPDGKIKSYSGDDINISFYNKDTRFGTTNKLRLFIRNHGLDGKKSNQKFVPPIIFNLENKKIALFLSRLFSCDGTIYKRIGKSKKENKIIIEYTSISDRLIRDISILLLRFGIQHTITSKKFRKNPDYSKRITISNHKNVREFIKYIEFIGRKQKIAQELYKKTKIHKFTNIDKVPRIIREYLKNKGYSYNQLDRFLNYEKIESLRKNKGYKKIKKSKLVKTPCVFMQGKIDFLREHLTKINSYVKDKNLSFLCNKDLLWDKIKSVEYVKNDLTYDLEVPEQHNFIANGIIVHNSAIALNLARKLGKTSIIVPIKSLQGQYIQDYTNDKYVMKSERFSIDNFPDLDKYPELNNNKKTPSRLTIQSIVGRKNFKCKFLQEKTLQPKPSEVVISEKNAKLFDIFEGKSYDSISPEKDDSCDNNFLPCKMEIKEKNLPRIKDFIKQNPDVKLTNFDSIKDIRRMTIAQVCPYWSPIVPEEYEIKKFKDAIKIPYMGIYNKKFIIHQRKKGCPYYDQYLAYANADVIIFNSFKYKLELLMNRKPFTEVEIIDECDEFLDSFANQEQISINRLSFALNTIFPESEKSKKIIDELIDITNTIKKKYSESEKIFPLEDSLIKDLFLTILQNPEFLDETEIDESSYLFNLDKTARTFQDFINETYFSIEKREQDISINLVTTNLEKRFNELIEKNKVLVMMSGTIHSEAVLKNIFGLKNFKIIEAETEHQGELIKCKHGYEIDCKYQNFKDNKISREIYLKALSKTISCAKKPTLIHLTSFSDLPTEHEKEMFSLENLPVKHEFISDQNNDPFGKRVTDFKSGKTKVLFTTKCTRGIDFPGETCNSIVITRFPYPNISSLFWKILKKTNPKDFMSFYMDKANREILQKIYRGLRSKKDKIYLLSPDIRVLNFNL